MFLAGSLEIVLVATFLYFVQVSHCLCILVSLPSDVAKFYLVCVEALTTTEKNADLQSARSASGVPGVHEFGLACRRYMSTYLRNYRTPYELIKTCL